MYVCDKEELICEVGPSLLLCVGMCAKKILYKEKRERGRGGGVSSPLAGDEQALALAVTVVSILERLRLCRFRWLGCIQRFCKTSLNCTRRHVEMHVGAGVENGRYGLTEQLVFREEPACECLAPVFLLRAFAEHCPHGCFPWLHVLGPVAFVVRAKPIQA